MPAIVVTKAERIEMIVRYDQLIAETRERMDNQSVLTEAEVVSLSGFACRLCAGHEPIPGNPEGEHRIMWKVEDPASPSGEKMLMRAGNNPLLSKIDAPCRWCEKLRHLLEDHGVNVPIPDQPGS